MRSVEVQLGYNYADHVMDNFSLRDFAATAMMPARAVSNPDRRTLGAKALVRLAPTEATQVSLGVDHIDYCINPQVEARFMLAAFRRFGSTAIPMHMALFNIPLNIAQRFGIPLVVWGENPAFEYGSGDAALTGFRLDSGGAMK